MKRTGLALGALLCAAAIGVLVCMPAGKSETVAPLPAIEEVWNIEDTHTLSETPLCTSLTADGTALGYVPETGTFYDPIGMDRAEWPEMKLVLPEGVSACFSDDYAWDSCADAVAAGNEYHILFWTETAYCYETIVFTGFPVLSVSCAAAEEDIGADDIPAQADWLAPEGGLSGYGRIHRRGASSFLTNELKRGYRLEFTKRSDGRKKVKREVPGLGNYDSIVLLPLIQDDTRIREKLSWTLWNQLVGDEEPFGARAFTYCEFILNGDYLGVYLAFQPFQAEEELEQAGGTRLLTDSLYRTLVVNLARGKDHVKHPRRANCGIAVYYAPRKGEEYAALSSYLDLVQEVDDTAFAEKFTRLIDTDSMLRQILFVQAIGATDNFSSNMYIWADGVSGKYRYFPWDLDMSWGTKKDYVGEEYANWLYFATADHALNLNIGTLREDLRTKWHEMASGVFSVDNVTQIAEACAHELNASGAMARDAARWQKESYEADPTELLDFYSIRTGVMDRAVDKIADAQGEVDFLSESKYWLESGPIFPETEEEGTEE